ncbi:MAG: glycosyltransferase family 2 protein [Symploca sp. SIO1A3]|nr:glycosyltransferase family 2 protein [Symploca sp. SIO2C1]NER51854.1 glycosyltransferase family 2 protein [Symploca sp. SIO1A3]
MSSQPLVSVITIFLNEEKFIEETIESIFAQTYNNWELLLVDDGSTDSSTQITQRYAEQYPGKVRYLEHEDHQNRGMSASRNLGIQNAKGEYIAFLDADDIYLPEKLTQQVAILESQPEAGMVYGPTKYWYSWTENPQDIQRDFMAKLGVQPNTLFNPPTLLTLCLKDPGIVPCTCGLLVKRKVCQEIGGFDKTFRSLYEDQVFFAKIFLNVPVFVEGGSWDKYRQHSDSSWHVGMDTGKEVSARLFFLNWLEKYLSEQSFKNTEVWHALQKALLPYRHPLLYNLQQRIEELVGQIKRIVKSMGRRLLLTNR